MPLLSTPPELIKIANAIAKSEGRSILESKTFVKTAKPQVVYAACICFSTVELLKSIIGTINLYFV